LPKEKKEEYNPASDCTDFISQIHDDESLYAQTDIPTPETLDYMSFLETIGDEETFNIPSAAAKARRLATMLISNEREGRKENVIGLVGHPGQQQINQYTGTMPSLPVLNTQPQEQKKKRWWSRG
jgi:hypothetical protein